MLVGRWRKVQKASDTISPADASQASEVSECPEPALWSVVHLAARSKEERPSDSWTDPGRVRKEVLHIGWDGPQGDYHHYRTVRHNGRRDWAVSIMTTEALGWLRDAGYGVGPADLGENITLVAREHDLSPGVRLRAVAGPSTPNTERTLVIEVRELIVPCRNLEHVPRLGLMPERQRRAFPRACLGHRGWFAKVICCGDLHAGDSLRVLSGTSADRPSINDGQQGSGRKLRWSKSPAHDPGQQEDQVGYPARAQ